MKRVAIITGSHHWDEDNREPIARALAGYDVVVHGGAEGADYVAEVVAAGDAAMTPIALPYWGRLGKRGGPRRNDELVKLALLLRELGCEVTCHAFPLPDSTGTWDAVRKMRAAGIETVVHETGGGE